MKNESGEKQRLTLQEAKDQVSKTYFDAYNQYFTCWKDFENACWREGDSVNLSKATDKANEIFYSQSLPIREKPDSTPIHNQIMVQWAKDFGSIHSDQVMDAYTVSGFIRSLPFWKDYVEPIPGK
jgi:hypothetical protein